jgi:Ni2+-binding GTPase involved in maturation of urease and hydrogenase
MGVDVAQLKRDVHTLKPSIRVIPASCKTGAGLDEIAAAVAPRKQSAHA